MITTLIIITLINAGILVLGYLVYRKTKTAGVDPDKHSLPVFTDDGKGVSINNKNGEPVIKFEKELL